ncbi:hypothetical protein, variant [Salpingoeca rosetta]|nr:hypothetical protein, variant [Salpingoeca rosetta]EGD72134.1 hypothetical protein, variant [Salpingoeca rosetta]|eukprot:XP_004998706.1 hypothetical protein, variant [Salpingoeca rosetta]
MYRQGRKAPANEISFPTPAAQRPVLRPPFLSQTRARGDSNASTSSSSTATTTNTSSSSGWTSSANSSVCTSTSSSTTASNRGSFLTYNGSNNSTSSPLTHMMNTASNPTKEGDNAAMLHTAAKEANTLEPSPSMSQEQAPSKHDKVPARKGSKESLLRLLGGDEPTHQQSQQEPQEQDQEPGQGGRADKARDSEEADEIADTLSPLTISSPSPQREGRSPRRRAVRAPSAFSSAPWFNRRAPTEHEPKARRRSQSEPPAMRCTDALAAIPEASEEEEERAQKQAEEEEEARQRQLGGLNLAGHRAGARANMGMGPHGRHPGPPGIGHRGVGSDTNLLRPNPDMRARSQSLDSKSRPRVRHRSPLGGTFNPIGAPAPGRPRSISPSPLKQSSRLKNAVTLPTSPSSSPSKPTSAVSTSGPCSPASNPHTRPRAATTAGLIGRPLRPSPAAAAMKATTKTPPPPTQSQAASTPKSPLLLALSRSNPTTPGTHAGDGDGNGDGEGTRADGTRFEFPRQM